MKGSVIDRDSRDFLAGAQVILSQNLTPIDSTITDSLGKFAFTQLPQGMYSIRVSAEAYRSRDVANLAIQSKQLARIDIPLAHGKDVEWTSVTDASDAETSINGIGEKATNTSVYTSVDALGWTGNSGTVNMAAFEVVEYSVPLINKYGTASGGTVTREDIANMPGRSAQSLATTVGGVYEDQSTGDLHIRGGRANANAYYIDGVRVTGGSLPAVPKSAIESVNVITGGVPANYGDATGGIVTIETRSPLWQYYPDYTAAPSTTSTSNSPNVPKNGVLAAYYDPYFQQYNTEEYEVTYENDFLNPFDNALSTFSIDVDAASYSNARRFLANSQLPPRGAVRTEEFINYFDYDYELPGKDEPFSVNVEASDCPWNEEHQLVHIGLKGYEVPAEELPPSNLVFLVDVSGSMSAHNKLPLLKKSLQMLVKKMRPEDRISIVVYAGSAGCVLPSTSGKQKSKILGALHRLESGGSTNGGAGIQLAYKIAQENMKKNGNNRVILCTDGDFNVGATSTGTLEELIAEKRETGVFLTVLGFGMGNYKDHRLETLADHGNGNYAYIDNLLEAKKFLVTEMSGTLLTIAKDVKIQVEFNPTQVKAYRLIGYENRLLAAKDFNDDTKDAGELGAGHTVTALYEIIPSGSNEDISSTEVDDLKYQTTEASAAAAGNELMTIKLRYKKPDEDESRLIEKPVLAGPSASMSNNFRFSAAVAAFSMLLKDSEFKGEADYAKVIQWATDGLGDDKNGYRYEFLHLVKTAEALSAAS